MSDQNNNGYPIISTQEPLLENKAPNYNNNTNYAYPQPRGYTQNNQPPYVPANQQYPPPPNYPYNQQRNQGFNPNQYPNQQNLPNNQGYVPNQQPVYIPNQQQIYVPNQNPIVVVNGYQNLLLQGRMVICPVCQRQTDSILRKIPGGVTWMWCFGLFIFTGICCCIPFCVDSCQDTEIVCTTCQFVKARVEANCC